MFKLFITSLFAAVVGTVAFAHTDEMLDTMVAPHGGQLRMAGPYHLELLVKENSVELYVTDHAGVKKEVKLAKASLMTTVDKKLQKFDFHTPVDNQLTATAALPKQENLQLIINFQMGSEKPVTAKFTPFKKAEHSHDKKNDHHDHSHNDQEHKH